MALTTEITPAEIREFSQRLFKGDQLLGELKVTGPMDLTNLEGRLKVEVASIDRHVLNLVGAPLGIDFGATTLNSTTDLTLAKGGSTITANTRFDAAKFSLTQDGQTTPPLDLQLALDVAVDTAAESATVQSFTINGTQNQRPLLRASLAQPMDLAWGANATGAGDSALDLEVTNFDLAEWKAVAGDAVSKGKLSARLKLLSQQGGKLLKLALDSQIADLAANAGAEPLTQAKLILKLDGELTDFKEVNVGSYRIELTEKQQPALKVSGSAAYDGATFNLQSDLEAVMATLMGSGPETPLAAGVKLDGRFADQVLELRQLQVALSPTARAAKNEFVASGRIDLATPGMTKGNLLVNSDTLDLTDLYDAFTAAPADAPAPAPTQPAPGSSGNEEPEPVVLPLQFTVEAVLDRLFLHEIAITNLQSVVRVDGGKIALDPFRLTLNGAPVNANIDLDLGIKGYTYALAVSMDKVPLEPIANTFSPANRGKYQGFILVDANITGAGVTGASLQKNLGGRAGFSFTNANLQVVSPRAQRLLVPIATLLRLNELTQTPLNWLQASTELGGGNITLSRFAVQGEAFDARTHGTIPIAQVLTNSPLNLPVEFSLRRSLADKAGLLPANTPTNVAYATLPQFVTVSGTLGEPKSEVNKLALGGLLLKSGAGIAEKLGVKVGSEAGKVIQGVGNLLTGEKSDAAKEEKSEEAPKPNLLDLFKKPKD
ncbi:MAG TPA: hypothetical protein DCY13_22945 [Verrucomicrobiales bacterium]|nr:hypothetical protein [Verrucomicrobiales bacterium]